MILVHNYASFLSKSAAPPTAESGKTIPSSPVPKQSWKSSWPSSWRRLQLLLLLGELGTPEVVALAILYQVVTQLNIAMETVAKL